MKLTNNIFDRWVFWLVMLLATLPFGQILHVRLPGVTLNAFELIWISLLCILLLKILYIKNAKNFLLIISFVGVSLSSIICSVAFLDVSVKSAVVQLRFYLPFGVALLLFTAGTSISAVRWVNGFVIAAGLSSFSALFIHHVIPEFLESALSSSEELLIITLFYGRMFWSNTSLAFFVLLSIFCNELKVRKWILLVILILSFAAMFNTLNRTMLVGYILFLVCAILFSDNTKIFIKRSFTVVTVMCCAAILVISLSFFDERVASLINVRFFGSGDISNIYYIAVEHNRLVLYEQYMQSIAQHFPFGQGLGRPFSSLNGRDVYTTDISFMSFLLPFGVLGVLIFGLFIYRLFVIIGKTKGVISKQTRMNLFLFVSLFLGMSLNYDFFTRKNFVIYLTILVISLCVPSEGKVTMKPKWRYVS